MSQTLLERCRIAVERLRISRDIHDIVAHSLSVISVQSDAAAAALDHDPARAREPLRVIGEVTKWQGHPPERIEQMKEGLARLKAEGKAVIID